MCFPMMYATNCIHFKYAQKIIVHKLDTQTVFPVDNVDYGISALHATGMWGVMNVRSVLNCRRATLGLAANLVATFGIDQNFIVTYFTCDKSAEIDTT